MVSEDLRCAHCDVIILRKERAAEGIPVPQHCPMCGERVETETKQNARPAQSTRVAYL